MIVDAFQILLLTQSRPRLHEIRSHRLFRNSGECDSGGCAGAVKCRGPSHSVAHGGLAGGLAEAGVRDLIAFLTSAR